MVSPPRSSQKKANLMKSESYDVNVRKLDEASGKKVTTKVGVATYPVYDSVSECVESIGEAKALDLLNSQTRTNELNRVRGLSRPGGISKTALRNKAMVAITGDEWMSVAGNPQAMEALIEKKMEEIKAESESGGDGAEEDGDQD